MTDVNLKYCSRFRYVECYFIKCYDSYNSLQVVFHAKKATKKSIFTIFIYKVNGKFEFTLIAHNVSAKYNYCFDYRFENDINALAIFNDLCEDSYFASKVKKLINLEKVINSISLINPQKIINSISLPNNKKSDTAIITKYIYPLSKEASIDDLMTVLPRELKDFGQLYVNDSYIGYGANLELREPIYFEAGTVFAAQRLLICLIRNSIV